MGLLCDSGMGAFVTVGGGGAGWWYGMAGLVNGLEMWWCWVMWIMRYGVSV